MAGLSSSPVSRRCWWLPVRPVRPAGDPLGLRVPRCICCPAFNRPFRRRALSYSRHMLDTYPGTCGVDAAVLAAAIDALSDCAQACTADVDADLSEQNLAEMVKCIRLCLDCTDVCTATLGVVSRQTHSNPAITRPLLEACVAVCKSCGDECERHSRQRAFGR